MEDKCIYTFVFSSQHHLWDDTTITAPGPGNAALLQVRAIALLINNWNQQTRTVDDPMKDMSRLLRTSQTEVWLKKCDSKEGLRLKSDLDAKPLDLSFCTCEMRKALDPAS